MKEGERFRNNLEYEEALLSCIRELLQIYSRSYLVESSDGVLCRPGGIIVRKEEAERLFEDRTPPAEVQMQMREQFQKLHGIRRLGRDTMRTGIIIPMEYLLHAFGLTDTEAFMVILAWAAEKDPSLRAACSLLNDYNRKAMPTLELCIRLCAHTKADRLVLQKSCMERWNLLAFFFSGMYENCRQQQAMPEEGFLEMGLKLEYRILLYLQDYTSRDPMLEYLVRYDYQMQGELLIHQQIFDGLEQILDHMEHPSIIFISGERGSGKKHLLAGVCKKRKRELLLVNAKRLPEAPDELGRILVRIIREARLRADALICFDDLPCFEVEDGISRSWIEALMWELRYWKTDIVLASDDEWNGKIETCGRRVYKIQIPETTTEERLLLWKSVLTEEEMPKGLDLEFLADKYMLSAGAIRQSAEDYRSRRLMEQKEPQERWLMEACRQQLDHRLGKDAVRIQGLYQWDDLVLPDAQKQMLRDACDQVLYRHQVYHKWGYEKKVAYGKGVSMIFYGPPGTGKTMAAQVIANELELELYKVDMAGVMSKYVGESEKKLGNIFEQAKRSQSILFFDEADVLFGKRTDQKDSNDKYANASTAYLLQKIEEYEGIIILATNLLQNFDNAFLRRFKFIIEFPFTDKERRLQIWQKVFPKETPVEALDLEFLAAEFKFSGSQIKNVAVAAAFLAAAEKTSVGMRHVLTALKREVAKTGKTLIAADFGPYYYLMEEENTHGIQ
jgi:hypothetical protein